MAIQTQQSFSGFVASDPQLSRTENGDARLYMKVGKEHYRQEEDGSFTQLETTFHHLVALGLCRVFLHGPELEPELLPGVNDLGLAHGAKPRRNIIGMVAHRADLAAPVIVAALACAQVRMLAAPAIVRRHWHFFTLVVLRHDAQARKVGEIPVCVDIEPGIVRSGCEHIDSVAGLAHGLDWLAARALVGGFYLRRV